MLRIMMEEMPVICFGAADQERRARHHRARMQIGEQGLKLSIASLSYVKRIAVQRWPAAAWRQSRFRFRRRKRCATAAYCSGSQPPIQSVSIRRSNAGNRASAIGNGRTSCGGPAVLESSKTFAASRAGDRPASRTRPVRSGRRRASPIRPGRNRGSRFRIIERTYAARSAPIGSAGATFGLAGSSRLLSR